MYEFETDRLKMRLLKSEDEAFFVSLYTDPKIMRYIASPLTQSKALSSFKTGLSLNQKQPLKQIIWVIMNKDTHNVLGIQSLNMHYENQLHAEAGLILSRLAQGKGFPEEALVGMLKYAFKYLSMETIFAYCSLKNRASKRVVLKAGFKHFTTDEKQLSFSIKSN